MLTQLILGIKVEPTIEEKRWSLIAVSEAARKWRNRFELKTNKCHSAGRSRCNDIHLPSPFCSKVQCTLQVSDTEIIMKDQVCFHICKIMCQKISAGQSFDYFELADSFLFVFRAHMVRV